MYTSLFKKWQKNVKYHIFFRNRNLNKHLNSTDFNIKTGIVFK